jgi:hypothetical protein
MAKQSVTISFVTSSMGDDGISLFVDMDDEQNEAENDGRTSTFIYGDTAYFRVFPSPIEGVSISCYPSDGSVISHGEHTADVDEIISFTDNTVTLEKPVFSDFSVEQVSETSCGAISVNPDNPSEAMASQAGPGVYRATYTAKFQRFSISIPSKPAGISDDEAYPVVVSIVGSEI